MTTEATAAIKEPKGFTRPTMRRENGAGKREWVWQTQCWKKMELHLFACERSGDGRREKEGASHPVKLRRGSRSTTTFNDNFLICEQFQTAVGEVRKIIQAKFYRRCDKNHCDFGTKVETLIWKCVDDGNHQFIVADELFQ